MSIMDGAARLVPVAIFALGMSFGMANAMEPKEIMEHVKLQGAAPDDQVSVKMKLVDASGDVKERTATSYAKREDPSKPEMRKLIRFHTPPEMDKAAVLTLENDKSDNEQWIYIPAVFTSRRIPSSNRGDRYMGTDFSYEDVVSVKVEQYAFAQKGEEEVDGRKCVIIEQVPTDEKLKKESGYSKVIQWVDPGRFVIAKADYYDRSGSLLKHYTATGFKKYGDYYRASHVEMEDVKAKHKTIIDYSDRKIGSGIADKLFTVRSMERGV